MFLILISFVYLSFYIISILSKAKSFLPQSGSANFFLIRFFALEP